MPFLIAEANRISTTSCSPAKCEADLQVKSLWSQTVCAWWLSSQVPSFISSCKGNYSEHHYVSITASSFENNFKHSLYQ